MQYEISRQNVGDMHLEFSFEIKVCWYRFTDKYMQNLKLKKKKGHFQERDMKFTEKELVTYRKHGSEVKIESMET